MFVPIVKQPIVFSDHIVIIPALTFANVPQLSVDVLLTNLEFERIGYFDDDSVLPLAGGISAFQSENVLVLNHNEEEGVNNVVKRVYEKDLVQSKLVARHNIVDSPAMAMEVIQQRAPYVRGQGAGFVTRLLDWLKKSGVYQILLLSSSDEKRRRDEEILLKSPLVVRTVEQCKECEPSSRRPTIDIIAKAKDFNYSLIRNCDCAAVSNPNDNSKVWFPKRGFVNLFCDECSLSGFNLVNFVMFCCEGENISDSLWLTSIVAEFLGIEWPVDIHIPRSLLEG